jgi:ATP-dependent helicase HrpB
LSAESYADHPLAVALRAALAAHRDAVLQAPPGAGKSTLVPLALLAEPWLQQRRILLLEPRRVAARAVAQRMAWLLHEQVGATVGYRMRLDTRVSRATRIEVITEGVLTRMLQQDPELPGVGCVIFDEFHERSLQADVGLALCIDARTQLDAGYRLLAMSATLDGARVAALLDAAPVVEVPGRQFPVAIHYVGRALPLLPSASESPERFVAQIIRRALGETEGDLLVFLPGAGEIRRLQGLLGDLVAPGLQLLALYGELGAQEQDAVLSGHEPGLRRIVLATNIAETSVTIPGVTVVIDTGLARRLRFDPATGMSRLELTRISRASAEQRAGRAGRTQPGVCYRLWGEGAHASLAAHTAPEIAEADLAPLALELAQWGSADALSLKWLDAPPAAQLQQARELLQRLGALDAAGSITAMGRQMAALPVHPRLAHMLLASAPQRGAHSHGRDAGPSLAAELAALLSERDLLRGAGLARDADIRSRLELLHGERGAMGSERGILERVRRSAAHLQRLAGAGDDGATPGSLLALAFPDRIAQRRGASGGRYLLSNGRGAAFPGQAALAAQEYLVAVELDDREREARIDLAAPITRAEIEARFGALIIDEQQVSWDPRSAAVLARRLRRLAALILDDHPLPQVPAALAASAMLSGVRQLGSEALPWDRDTRNLQARMEFVRGLKRTALINWPASDDATLLRDLEHWLPAWLEGITRREQLARLPLKDALLARLDSQQRRALDELAPRELAVPSGSRIRIDYVDDNAPCIEVRLQEVFGLAATPRIGGNSVPVTFKLLSPAQRPVQITRDLAGFWQSGYVEVRKEMRGRYPRHNWPEDPMQAAPSRGARRRK